MTELEHAYKWLETGIPRLMDDIIADKKAGNYDDRRYDARFDAMYRHIDVIRCDDNPKIRLMGAKWREFVRNMRRFGNCDKPRRMNRLASENERLSEEIGRLAYDIICAKVGEQLGL